MSTEDKRGGGEAAKRWSPMDIVLLLTMIGVGFFGFGSFFIMGKTYYCNHAEHLSDCDGVHSCSVVTLGNYGSRSINKKYEKICYQKPIPNPYPSKRKVFCADDVSLPMCKDGKCKTTGF
jgi:hypothetical protein